MKSNRLAGLLLLPFFLATLSVTARAKLSGMEGADIRTVPASRTESSPGEEIVHSSLASLCPDIAETKVFREAGLGYVHSVEFARSVFAVANGTSKYSPREIPPNWKAAAYGWWTHVATGAKASIRYLSGKSNAMVSRTRGAAAATSIRPRIQTTIGRQVDYDRESLGEHSCDPSLLFHASLDYRDKTGQDGIALAYPYRVRMASKALDSMISAKYAAANRLASQADRIWSRIADAERMGAAVCQAKELSLVKAEFEQAIEVATDIDRTLEEAEAALARAEESSAELFAQRQYASSRGIPCLHAN